MCLACSQQLIIAALQNTRIKSSVSAALYPCCALGRDLGSEGLELGSLGRRESGMWFSQAKTLCLPASWIRDDVIAPFNTYSVILIDWGLDGLRETHVVDAVAEICYLISPVRC